MGRMYSVIIEGASLSSAGPLFRFLPAANVPIIIHSFTLSQTTVTAQENLIVNTNRPTTDGTGTSATPRALDPGSPAADAVVATWPWTVTPTPGDVIQSFPWNAIKPLRKIWLPNSQALVPGGARWGIGVGISPSETLTIFSEIIFEELG